MAQKIRFGISELDVSKTDHLPFPVNASEAARIYIRHSLLCMRHVGSSARR